MLAFKSASDPNAAPIVVDTGFLAAFIVWIALGFGAFVMSLVCFTKKGHPGSNVLGLLLAIFLGPFYWLYYLGSGSYCRAPKVAS